MIKANVTGFDSVEQNLLAMAAKCPQASTQAAAAGAMVVMGFAKREGFRTVGEQIGTKANGTKKYAALGKPVAGILTSRTGTLRSSIQVVERPERTAAEVGPSAVYGAIHEFGGQIQIGARSWRGGFTKSSKRKKNQSVLGQYRKRHSIGGATINMPARPYMRPALNKHRPEINKAIIRSLIKGLALKT